MFAYIWIWAGFSMVVIAAGLASIPRDTLEAARTDGATEWQVFRRITVPLLAPVLSVVFITMLINVLKVFDIVIALAPGSVQDDANVIALDMWRTSFGGISDFGYGSAIAVFLFILVIPILLLNIRRFRREADGGDRGRGTPARARRTTAAADPALPREGARSTSSWSCRDLLADPDARPLPDLADGSVAVHRAGLVEHHLQAEPGHLDNYDEVFNTEAITSALWTTVLISVGGTILPIFVASMAGYAFAWLEFPGRDWLFIGVIAMLVVPIQMALIPIF